MRIAAGARFMLGALWALAISFTGGCETSTSDKSIVLVDAGEVKALLAQAARGQASLLVIDPRTSARFGEGRLPGARRMKLPGIAAGNDPAIAAYPVLLVYGDNPADPLAKAMTKRLLQLRYSGVRFYAGGFEEWRRLGNPIERDEPASPGP